MDGPPRTTAVGVTGAPANNHLRQGKVLFSTFRPDGCPRGSHSPRVAYLSTCFPLSVEMELLGKHFHLLSALPPRTRSSLLQQLSEVLEEPGAVGSLHRAVSGAEGSVVTINSANLNRCSFPCFSWTRRARMRGRLWGTLQPQSLRNRTPFWSSWSGRLGRTSWPRRSQLFTSLSAPWMVRKGFDC